MFKTKVNRSMTYVSYVDFALAFTSFRWLLYYLAFLSFDHRRYWWRLFQK